MCKTTDPYILCHNLLERAITAQGWALRSFTVEPPRDPAHGDMASNAAMVLAKPLKQNPRVIADTLAAALRDEAMIEAVEVAGPGFINIRLHQDYWQQALLPIVQNPANYGRADVGKGEKINLEYVSANPTGPMHVGHTRGAVVGDALASLLEFVGYQVTREYYVNDAGAQISALARSAYWRYQELFDQAPQPMPEGLYPGGYLVPLAETIKNQDGDKWLRADDWLDYFREQAVSAMLDMIREDLAALGIKHDEFTSERSLIEKNAIEQALQTLRDADLVYTGTLPPPKGKKPDDWEEKPQLLFKSTDFGDDTDRALQKSDGAWTYLAGDLANNADKIARGYDEIITVLGADHGGYVKRLNAVVAALSNNKVRSTVTLTQLVNLFKDGQPFRMSKRAGTFVTARDLIDEVGVDVVRFSLLSRPHTQSFDLDLSKFLEQSKDNPVFYVQYAHARCCSVLRHAGLDDASLQQADTSLLATPHELAMIKSLASYGRAIRLAADHREPHRIAHYVQEVAGQFHALWNTGNADAQLRFIDPDNKAVTAARLMLVKATATVIKSGLNLLGVTAVEEMT